MSNYKYYVEIPTNLWKVGQNVTIFVIKQFNKTKTMKLHTLEFLTVDKTH